MLLKVLQHTGQPLITKNYLTLNVNGGMVEKPRFKCCKEERKEKKWTWRTEDGEKEMTGNADHRPDRGGQGEHCSPGVGTDLSSLL